jgi:uracil phosphoribosyltransferase
MKISETYETFAVGKQGGPLFFILMMNHLLSNTEEAAISLNNRVKKFNIKTVEGENIFCVVSLLRGAVKRIQHINKMPDDIVRTLLNVMQTSSVESFNQQFNHLQKQRKQKLRPPPDWGRSFPLLGRHIHAR